MKWSAINSADLRLEQGCHEERVLSELNRFDARIISPGADREPVISETADICRRDSEVAPMKAHEGRAAAERVQASSWHGCHGALLRNQTAR